MRLVDPDPLAPPSIRFDLLCSEYDMRAVVMGVRLARRITEQPALRPMWRIGVPTITPATPARWAGTNKVVDPRLRVHGIDGLRMADASIVVSAVAGTTNVPSIMIGEKAAAILLGGLAA